MSVVLTSNAVYQPFTFEELLKPLAMYTEEYRNIEDDILDLEDKSAALKAYMDTNSSSESSRIYRNYMNQLEQEASMLASRGLQGRREGLLGLKRRYNRNIKPLENKLRHRETMAKEQREALAKDNSLIFDNDYSMMSLDDIDVNKSYKQISLNSVTEKTAKQVLNAAKSVVNNPEYKSVFGGQFVEQKLREGYSIDQILNAISNSPNAPRELKNIRQSIKSQLDLEGFDINTESIIDDAISQGMLYGVGQVKTNIQADRDFVSAFERQKHKDTMDAARTTEYTFKYVDPKRNNEEVQILTNKAGSFIIAKDSKGNIIDNTPYRNLVYRTTKPSGSLNPLDSWLQNEQKRITKAKEVLALKEESTSIVLAEGKKTEESHKFNHTVSYEDLIPSQKKWVDDEIKRLNKHNIKLNTSDYQFEVKKVGKSGPVRMTFIGKIPGNSAPTIQVAGQKSSDAPLI